MKVLITAPFNESGRKFIEDHIGNVVYEPWKKQGRAYNENELMALLQSSQAEALITEHDHVTDNVINANHHLKFIGVCRGTPSNVSLTAAQQYGIPVFHTPARNAQAVAEMWIANVIAFMRKVIPSVEWLKAKEWGEGAHTSYLQFKGAELANKTVGMVGFGAVGQRIAEMLQPFPCAIKFYDPFVENYDQMYVKTSIEEVFRTSDIVSVHLPVNQHTIGMIDAALLNTMRKDAIFVNTARASVVERKALIDVVLNRKIKGAVLDVFDHEPPDELDYQLINAPNVLATPHTAGATFEVEDHHVTILNKQLLAWKQENLLAKS
jgi:D-3-phosphoglycerate dehydrogenase